MTVTTTEGVLIASKIEETPNHYILSIGKSYKILKKSQIKSIKPTDEKIH